MSLRLTSNTEKFEAVASNSIQYWRHPRIRARRSKPYIKPKLDLKAERTPDTKNHDGRRTWKWLGKDSSKSSTSPTPVVADNWVNTPKNQPSSMDITTQNGHHFSFLEDCRVCSLAEFQILSKIEEGSYGVVYRAKDLSTNETVALKRFKIQKEADGSFPVTSLREIKSLIKVHSHVNIITLRALALDNEFDNLFLVMDYVEHDLKTVMDGMKEKRQIFMRDEVKCLLRQLCRAVAHLHRHSILHRDLKSSNILLSSNGVLKVCDFGMSREYSIPLEPYSPVVVTLWYRAPELLLGSKFYSTSVDLWSVGCIFGELLRLKPMFPGKSEINQLDWIFKTLGSPNEKTWPGYSSLPLSSALKFKYYSGNKLQSRFSGFSSDLELEIDLMNKFFTYRPEDRISAEDALGHDFFGRETESNSNSMVGKLKIWTGRRKDGHVEDMSSLSLPQGPNSCLETRIQEYLKLNELESDSSNGFFIKRAPIGEASFILKF